MAVSNAQQPGNPQQGSDDYVTDQDVQARKRTAIGLSPHRETARTAVQRPPDAGSRFPLWLLVACLMLLAAAVGILLVARSMDSTAPPKGPPPDYLSTFPGYKLWMADDFTKVNSNVAVYDAPDQMKAAVLPNLGVYELTVSPGQIGWTLFDLTQLPGFRLETSAIIDESTPEGSAGIIGRFASEDKFYLFTVDGDGAAQVQKWDNGKSSVVRKPIVLPGVNRAGEPNRLRLQDADGKLRFLVNEDFVYEVDAPQWPPGRAGMAAISGDKVATVDFEWVAIYRQE